MNIQLVSDCQQLPLLSPDEPNTDPSKTPAKSIPFDHLIFNPDKEFKQVLQHCHSVYESVFFLNGLSSELKEKIAEKAQQKAVMLKPRPSAASTNKTLFLDLDETLIHCVISQSDGFSHQVRVQEYDVTHFVMQVFFNLRPYAIDFLINMSQLYELVLFTAADKHYAEAFFEFLNLQSNGAISQFLCRDHCIHLYKKVFVKDLRVVSNRQLKNMVLLDNSAHSFGGLMNNGVPIKSFISDQRDLELMHIEPYLQLLSQAKDVREYNRQELKLLKILSIESLDA